MNLPFQTSTLDVLSLAEAVAVARYVSDLQIRMQTVVDLLQDRGNTESVHLAKSIAANLTLLQQQLSLPQY